MSDLVRAEWIKFASLRGSWIRVGTALALDLLLLTVGLWFFNRSIGDVAPDTGVPARVSTVVDNFDLASLLIVVAGVMVFTSEIKTRGIIPTISAAPDRRELIGAKTILVALVGLATAAVATVLNIAIGMFVLDQEGFALSFDDTDFARAIFGGLAFLTIAGLFGLGIGIIANSSTLGIAIGLLWPAAIETSARAFLPDWISRFLPFEAGSALTSVPAPGDVPPWEGGGVFLLWASALILVGLMLFRRRDLGSS